jgi:hypothetical protein
VLICSEINVLLADCWCWFVLRETYCWLIAGGWFVLREKYCWLVADKPSEHGSGRKGGGGQMLHREEEAAPINLDPVTGHGREGLGGHEGEEEEEEELL